MTDPNNPWHHDSDDPMGVLNGIEATWLGSDSTITRCGTCTPITKMLPMGGPGWAVEVIHEPGCPEHDDNLPTPERPDPGLGDGSEDW